MYMYSLIYVKGLTSNMVMFFLYRYIILKTLNTNNTKY